MKKILCVSIFTVFVLAACYKPPEPRLPVVYFNTSPDSSYLSTLEKFIRQHPAMGSSDEIDFANYRVSRQRKCWYARLPFKNKPIGSDFIVLQTDSLGNAIDGRIVHLEKKASNPEPASPRFNGSIDISSPDRANILHSNITGGFIESFHPALFAANTKSKNNKIPGIDKAESFPVPIDYDELPEVIVVGYTSSAGSGGISLSDYMMLVSLFSGSGGASTTGGGSTGNTSGGYNGNDYGYGVYNPADGLPLTPSNGGGTAGPYGTGTNSPSTPPHVDPNMTLVPDESFSRPAIDLNAWVKCFTNIPDAGATCSVTLCGDLPVPSDPSIGLNIWNGNTGHCFLQLSKTNGFQSITQIIGFTAQSAGKAIVNTEAFVPGKTIDNAGHKYNCSITMDITPTGLNTIIDKMKSLSDRPYSVVNYDCLDYGLEVMNTVRGNNPLVISKLYDPSDPFSNIATGPKLYNLLQNMVQNGSAETPNILLGNSLYAGVSHGPCN